MFIVLGLLVLIAAVVVGVSIAAADLDRMRAPAGDFEIFGSLFTPTVGEVFGVGILVGAAGMLGLLLLSTGVWRSARRGSEARRELRRSRREVAAARRAAPAPQAPAGGPPPPPPAPGGGGGGARERCAGPRGGGPVGAPPVVPRGIAHHGGP
ncbi:hypothetical protein [Nocardia farcinica]|uniref:hypothetical protein n=1 Tax=Nocardia farcinica TaxID=37329 RepID=UPI0024546D50|nr:hypothetical protein [Nocardia farcinica]